MSSTKTSELPPVPQTQASPAHPILADQSAPAPPSAVADYDYPNVPEMTEPQQAATGPGQGSVVEDQPGEKLPFKEQVNGYAKNFAGKVFKK